MRIAHVVVDVPSRQIETHFDYLVPEDLAGIEVGSCVLVDFGPRPVVGYVVGLAGSSEHGKLRQVQAVLGGPYFSTAAARTARWIASEYVCPLSEALRLFLPPGGTPKAAKDAVGSWTLRRPDVGAVDDRWVELVPDAPPFVPAVRATTQRAVLDALAAGPVRAAELAADLGSVDAALKRLSEAGVVRVERRRRLRSSEGRSREDFRPASLTPEQGSALEVLRGMLSAREGTLLLDGVTGSGKTEVYLRAIEDVLAAGGGAIVLVPEISLTPQTVGRFRARFGADVAVLHSRLGAGERFDQWDLVRTGQARVVVGARSALFAPVRDLALIVIDEEHEASYKQASAPRYHARETARKLCTESEAVLVLGSATPAFETLHAVSAGRVERAALRHRATEGALPPVTVIDMAAEFASGNRTMFSSAMRDALREVEAARSKAVLMLNRRGFASFLLCRECGFVPGCDSCSTSLTYHEVGSRLMCHHCGATSRAPVTCPSCNSPYLRRFGAGTQRVEAELAEVVPGLPIVRMDADTTRGKGGHERRLAEFEGLQAGILLGTQMIAKGLDYPQVTLVGVINADTTLRFPDFRAAERTWQLLEQVGGRAGRGRSGGKVIVQTYWPAHPAIVAAATHDRSALLAIESAARADLGYPPFGRLVNVLVTGEALADVRERAHDAAERLRAAAPKGWTVLGPAPAPLARVQRAHRWHVMLKAPADAAVADAVRRALDGMRPIPGTTLAVDVDPVGTA